MIAAEQFKGEEHVADMKSNKQICLENNLLLPENLIRRMRLSLFARLVRKQVTAVCDLVFSTQFMKNTWAASVLDDLKVFSFLELHSFFTPGQAYSSLEEWRREFLELSIGQARKIISVSCAHPLINLPRELGEDELGNSGLVDLDPTTRSLCDICQRAFPTAQALSVHMFKAHGKKSVWRQYVGEELHCIVCLKMFWSRERVVNHIRYRSKICRDQLGLCPPPYTQEEADMFDRAVAQDNRALHHVGNRRHKVVSPCVQLEGPVPPITILCPGTSSSHHPLGRGQNYGRV